MKSVLYVRKLIYISSTSKLCLYKIVHKIFIVLKNTMTKRILIAMIIYVNIFYDDQLFKYFKFYGIYLLNK